MAHGPWNKSAVSAMSCSWKHLCRLALLSSSLALCGGRLYGKPRLVSKSGSPDGVRDLKKLCKAASWWHMDDGTSQQWTLSELEHHCRLALLSTSSLALCQGRLYGKPRLVSKSGSDGVRDLRKLCKAASWCHIDHGTSQHYQQPHPSPSSLLG